MEVKAELKLKGERMSDVDVPSDINATDLLALMGQVVRTKFYLVAAFGGEKVAWAFRQTEDADWYGDAAPCTVEAVQDALDWAREKAARGFSVPVAWK